MIFIKILFKFQFFFCRTFFVLGMAPQAKKRPREENAQVLKKKNQSKQHFASIDAKYIELFVILTFQ